MLSLVLVGILAAVTALRPWRTLLPLAAVAALPAVAWRAWHWANDARDDSDYRFGDLFQPGLLWDRIDRLGIALREFPQYVLDPDRWLLSVPLALLLAALLARREPRLAGFCAGTLVVASLAYVAVFWISVPEIHFYLDASAERLASHLAVFAAALGPLLAAEAYPGKRRPIGHSAELSSIGSLGDPMSLGNPRAASVESDFELPEREDHHPQ